MHYRLSWVFGTDEDVCAGWGMKGLVPTGLSVGSSAAWQNPSPG